MEATPNQVPLMNRRAVEDMNRPLEREEMQEALKRARGKAAPGGLAQEKSSGGLCFPVL